MSTFDSFIKQWSTTPANNGTGSNVVPYGAPEGWQPSEVNNVYRQGMADHRNQWEDAEWFDHGSGVISVASATSFKVNSVDVTSLYLTDIRVKIKDTTTLYGTVTSSSFSTDTTVNVALDSGSLASASAVALAILKPTNTSIPRNAGTQPNIIIGGNFDTNPWQRGTTATGAANATFLADRFEFLTVGAGVVDIKKTADAPTVSQCGMTVSNCLHVDVTTADSSLAASDQYELRYAVEGYDFAHIFGKAFTLSFWHKHTKTGTHNVAFFNNAFDQYYIGAYTQNTTDTWEYATITVPAYTTGTWLLTTGGGLFISFPLAMGATLGSGVAATWTAATTEVATSSHVNNMDNTSNDFKLALIKLERGSSATPYPVEFEVDVLNKSLRYCFVANATSRLQACNGIWYTTTKLNGAFLFPVTMRIAPTITYTGTTSNFKMLQPGAIVDASAVASGNITTTSYEIDWDTATATTAGFGGSARITGDAVVTINAEI